MSHGPTQTGSATGSATVPGVAIVNTVTATVIATLTVTVTVTVAVAFADGCKAGRLGNLLVWGVARFSPPTNPPTHAHQSGAR